MVAQGKVVAAVLEVVATVVHPPIVGHQDARSAVFLHGEEGKG